MVSQPSRLKAAFVLCQLPAPSARVGPAVEAPLWMWAQGSERRWGRWGCAGGSEGAPGRLCRGEGPPSPETRRKLGQGSGRFLLQPFLHRQDAESGEQMDSEIIYLYLRKKKNHFNFANSTGVLKLAGILGSVQEKKGLEAAGGG